MVKLTEEMVCARTRVSDFSAVKKLNCWGTELTDVSLLRQMKNVQVLSLSVNSISTLADFQYCVNLQDLFVRKNNIRDINEVCYLQGLPNLRNLWLGENPCAERKGYRLAVLRALPNLEKLDDKIVSSEEVDAAMSSGHILLHPLDSEAVSPPQLTPDSPEESSDEIVHQDQEYREIDRRNANCDDASPPRHYQQNYQCIYDDYEEPVTSPRSNDKLQDRSDSPEYANSETNHRSYSDTSPRTHHPPEPVDERHSDRQSYEYDERRHMDCSEPVPQPRRVSTYQNVERDDTRLESNQLPGWVKYSDKETCTASRFLYQRRPVTRNSNILSAVLCLVKELDYPSLEVVEMAVRSRMDEIEQ